MGLFLPSPNRPMLFNQGTVCCFSTREQFAPLGTFGNVWRRFLVVITWVGMEGNMLLVFSGRRKNAAKHPTMHRTPPPPQATKNPLVQNVSSAEAFDGDRKVE